MSRVIQIRDVPDEVHDALTELARKAGMSINRFLLIELEHIARRARNKVIIERARAREGSRLSAEEIVGTLRQIRDAG